MSISSVTLDQMKEVRMVDWDIPSWLVCLMTAVFISPMLISVQSGRGVGALTDWNVAIQRKRKFDSRYATRIDHVREMHLSTRTEKSDACGAGVTVAADMETDDDGGYFTCS